MNPIQNQDPNPTAVVVAKDFVPTPPPGLKPEEQLALVTQADAFLQKVKDAGDRRAAEREFAGMGAAETQRASSKVALLQTRVGTLLRDVEDGGGPIPQGLLQLRTKMDEINPHTLGKPWTIFGYTVYTPKVPAVLRTALRRYETVQAQIDGIMNGLRGGKDQLLQDNAEMNVIYDDVQAAQREIQRIAYVGELLMEKLQQMLDATQEQAEREKITAVLHKVAIRVSDLRTMEQANLQFFVSLDLTTSNNTTLGEQVDRTLLIAKNLLAVALSIKAALANQKNVAQATQDMQEYLGQTLANNAGAIRTQGAEIAKMANNPVMAINHVRKGFDELMAALEETGRVREQGIINARSAIAQLTDMSTKLVPKVEALRAGADSAGELASTTTPAALPAATE